MVNSSRSPVSSASSASSREDTLRNMVAEAARFLPQLHPLTRFAHEHPLRPLNSLDFHAALDRLADIHAAECYLPLTQYAAHCASGRIAADDLESSLRADESSTGHVDRPATVDSSSAEAVANYQLPHGLGSRLELRISMLQVPESPCTDSQWQWLGGQEEADQATAESILAACSTFREWLPRLADSSATGRALLDSLQRDIIGKRQVNWRDSDWTRAREYVLWWQCDRAVASWQPPYQFNPRIRRVLIEGKPTDPDDEMRQVLVPFCRAYADPGAARWSMPVRELGFFDAFLTLYGQTSSQLHWNRTAWQKNFTLLLNHCREQKLTAVESIDHTLRAWRLNEQESQSYIKDLLGSLRGWAGLLHQLSRNEPGQGHSLANFSLVDFVAVQLLLDRAVWSHCYRLDLWDGSLTRLSAAVQRERQAAKVSDAIATRRWWLLNLAQHLNWTPETLCELSFQDWATIHHELNSFTKRDRQRVLQSAFERTYRRSTLDAIQLQQAWRPPAGLRRQASFVLLTCVEPGEESFRRHVEEVAPDAWTDGVPGFFDVDMLLKKIESSRAIPHAPANVRARHVVQEVHCTGLDDLPPALQISSYSHEEMASIVSRLLEDAGLTKGFARLVIVMGHESSSVNNLYEVADNCCFCANESARSNARVFARMANDHRMRDILRQQGIDIPDSCMFLAANRNTCSDMIEFPDLQQLPTTHAQDFLHASQVLLEAAKRNAHERCRRLCGRKTSLDQSLSMAEDLQASGATARPEYSSAGNALCVIGRRAITRGLFLDRRAFLVSYDRQGDDADLTILSRLMSVVLPVCHQISLNYWFSTVDNERFGAGHKSRLNIEGWLGVADSDCGDLKTGLPLEMVDHHEPMRMLVVVESSIEGMLALLNANRTVGRLFGNSQMQLVVLDHGRMFEYEQGRFEAYESSSGKLPCCDSSRRWYAGHSENLPVALIDYGVAISK